MSESQLFAWGLCAIGLVYVTVVAHIYHETVPRWARVAGIIAVVVWFAPVLARVWWHASGLAQ